MEISSLTCFPIPGVLKCILMVSNLHSFESTPLQVAQLQTRLHDEKMHRMCLEQALAAGASDLISPQPASSDLAPQVRKALLMNMRPKCSPHIFVLWLALQVFCLFVNSTDYYLDFFALIVCWKVYCVCSLSSLSQRFYLFRRKFHIWSSVHTHFTTDF